MVRCGRKEFDLLEEGKGRMAGTGGEELERDHMGLGRPEVSFYSWAR